MIHLLPLDLSDLHSVRRAAIEFMRYARFLYVFGDGMCSLQSLRLHERTGTNSTSTYLSIMRKFHMSVPGFPFADNQMNRSGVMSPPAALLTRQRYDYQFGVNVLGHFYLTQLLLPVLLTTTRAMPQTDKVRVIHYTCTLPQSCRIDYTTLMDGPVRRRRTPTELYQQSKLVCDTDRLDWTWS